MSEFAILAPVFAEVALTFALLLWLGKVRLPLVRDRVVRVEDIALDDAGWPENVRQASNAFANQFELPVLFYLLMTLALLTGHGGRGLVVLAWVFVALRVIHAVIHISSNNVRRRFLAYAAGFGVLAVMWLWFAVAVVAG